MSFVIYGQCIRCEGATENGRCVNCFETDSQFFDLAEKITTARQPAPMVDVAGCPNCGNRQYIPSGALIVCPVCDVTYEVTA